MISEPQNFEIFLKIFLKTTQRSHWNHIQNCKDRLAINMITLSSGMYNFDPMDVM